MYTFGISFIEKKEYIYTQKKGLVGNIPQLYLIFFVIFSFLYSLTLCYIWIQVKKNIYILYIYIFVVLFIQWWGLNLYCSRFKNEMLVRKWNSPYKPDMLLLELQNFIYIYAVLHLRWTEGFWVPQTMEFPFSLRPT